MALQTLITCIMIATLVLSLSGKHEAHTKRSVASSTEICRLYSMSETQEIKNNCPIITDEDFAKAQSECAKSLREADLSCKQSYTDISQEIDRMRNLNISSDLMFSKDMETYERLDTALQKLEALRADRNCEINPGLYAFLPMVSVVNPQVGFLAGAGSSLFSRFVKLSKNKKMGLNEKLSLCSVNTSVQYARSLSCRHVIYSDPQFLGGYIKNLEDLESRIQSAKNTKAWTFHLKHERAKKTFANYKSIKAGDKTEASYELIYDLMELQKSANCTKKTELSLCKEIDAIIKIVTDKLQNWKTSQPERQDSEYKIEQFLSRDFIGDIFEEYSNGFPDKSNGPWTADEYGIYAEKLEKYSKNTIVPYFEESLHKLGSVLSWGNPNGQKFARESRERIESNRRSSEPSARAFSAAIESLPLSLPKNFSDEALCQSLNCLWAKGSLPDVNKAANAAGMELRLGKAKEIHETGYDPLEPLNIKGYKNAGRILNSWPNKLKDYEKLLGQLSKKCSKLKAPDSKYTCELDCLERQEEDAFGYRGGINPHYFEEESTGNQ